MRKIVNTVICLILAVVMFLGAFVYYAWMVQKRTRDAAALIHHSTLSDDTSRNALKAQLDKDIQYTRYSFWVTLMTSCFILILLAGESRYIFYLFKKIKQRVNQLQKSEQSFRRLAEEAEPIFYTATPEGYFTYISGRAEEITGYTTGELVGKHYSFLLDEATFARLQEFYVHQMKSHQDYSSQRFEIITRSGERRTVEQLASIIRQDDGKARGFHCIVRDITKPDDHYLDHLRERLEAVIDFTPSMMFITDMNDRYLLVNNRFAEIFQVKKYEVIGKTSAELAHYHWVSRYAGLDQQVRQTGSSASMDDPITVNGQTFHFLITKFPLRNSRDELIGICGIGQDFTEKNNYTREQIIARKAAEEAMKAQETFLANVSHEIRTPMNGILGLTNMLLQTPLTRDQDDFLQSIKKSASHLLVIINEILDFSKIKAGKLDIEHAPFNIRDEINDRLFSLKLQAQEKQLSFFTEVDERIPQYVIGDPVRLNQILGNLVENAIKFTDKGHVSLQLTLLGKNEDHLRIAFDVSDTGIGIAPEMQEHIFKSFTQTHSDNNRKYGGTGLGLTISKELIDIQQGSISVISDPGKGACFHVELPFIVCHFPPAPKKQPHHHISEKPLLGKHILVVEDNEINRQVALHALNNAGARTAAVTDGSIAVELLHFQTYDCIIMDIQMPNMDGYQATRQIRANGVDTCIIAMTASAIKGERERCLQAGMNDYISKPFEPAILYEKILSCTGCEVPVFIPVTPPPVRKTADIDIQNAYRLMDNNEESVRTLLTDLMEILPEKFREMQEAVQEQRWEDLFVLAHQIKSNLNIIRLREAVDIAATIERDARLVQHLGAIPQRIHELISVYNEYLPEIEDAVLLAKQIK
ncbi:hybrid sensor histidine kinase/response regulator [Chitinophaga vietnamensis]|uniref:hybrid sensor histidine kinase/response regulator n=1 Tax=Chitinophaga vietnamensis TaxID=2593957 RepID=UPI001177E24E|nr:PAS domain S-box protein [Chitinophaga vietnamensis]